MRRAGGFALQHVRLSLQAIVWLRPARRNSRRKLRLEPRVVVNLDSEKGVRNGIDERADD